MYGPKEPQYAPREGRVHDLIAAKFHSPCYETVHGLRIYQFESSCPQRAAIERETTALYKRLKIKDPSILAGTKITFVSQLLICDDKGDDQYEIVWGCTRFDPKITTVYLSGDRYFWGQVLSHELAHSLHAWYFGGNGDPNHDQMDWETVEDIDA